MARAPIKVKKLHELVVSESGKSSGSDAIEVTYDVNTIPIFGPSSSSNCFGSLPTRAVRVPVEFSSLSKKEVFWYNMPSKYCCR